MKGIHTLAIDIFDPALQGTTSTSSFGDDIVGRFRSGYQINDRPAALTEWRLTTGDPDVAKAVHALLGGQAPQEWDTKSEETLEVFTDAPSLDIVLDGPGAIDARMLIWPRGQKRIVTCDNEVFETEGRPYECETGGFRNKREHEEQGHVCDPRISITFKVVGLEDLGYFKFETGAWSMTTVIARQIGRLQEIDGPAQAFLELEQVEMADGKKFTKPVLSVQSGVTA